jgi:hypothetical protein
LRRFRERKGRRRRSMRGRLGRGRGGGEEVDSRAYRYGKSNEDRLQRTSDL